MHIIKYRAWDGLFMRELTELHLGWVTGGAEGYYQDKNHGRQRLPKHVITVMQFTGLLDKNGKEIYEGDIVRGTFRNEFGSILSDLMTSVVQWEEDKACFVSDIKGEWYFLGKKLEVIGNIYENPELLKRNI